MKSNRAWSGFWSRRGCVYTAGAVDLWYFHVCLLLISGSRFSGSTKIIHDLATGIVLLDTLLRLILLDEDSQTTESYVLKPLQENIHIT